MNTQFTTWLWKKDKYDCYRYDIELIKGFERLKPSMKWGCYLAFFDSVGIEVLIVNWKHENLKYWNASVNNIEVLGNLYTRAEAQNAAITKAFEILEKK